MIWNRCERMTLWRFVRTQCDRFARDHNYNVDALFQPSVPLSLWTLVTKRTNLVLHRVLPFSIETFFVNSDQKRRSSKIYCSTEFSVQLRDFATVLAAWCLGLLLIIIMMMRMMTMTMTKMTVIWWWWQRWWWWLCNSLGGCVPASSQPCNQSTSGITKFYKMKLERS